MLSSTHVAITGNLFSDPADMVITVAFDDLLVRPDAVQAAIANGYPVHDRAMKVVVGPGPSGTAVVMRDPEAEEPPESDDDLPDTWGLRGYYLRRLSDGALIDRASYAETFDKDATIVATDRSIAIEVPDGVDLLARSGLPMRRIRGCRAAVDPVNARIGMLDGNERWTVEPCP
jgi:hypothetical protein